MAGGGKVNNFKDWTINDKDDSNHHYEDNRDDDDDEYDNANRILPCGPVKNLIGFVFTGKRNSGMITNVKGSIDHPLIHILCFEL